MKRYSDEFKEQAIGLAREASRSGKGVEPVARDLGVHPNTLRAWVQRDLVHAGDGKNTEGLEPKAQIEQLQKCAASTRRYSALVYCTPRSV